MGVNMLMAVQRQGDDGRWDDVSEDDAGISGSDGPEVRDRHVYEWLAGYARGGGRSVERGQVGGRGWPEDAGDMDRFWPFVDDIVLRSWATLAELSRLPWDESGLGGSAMARWARQTSARWMAEGIDPERLRVIFGFDP